MTLGRTEQPAAGASQVDMLVATTRKPSGDAVALYSGERAQAISITNVVISIPADSHRSIGEIQWPSSQPGNSEREFVATKIDEVKSQGQVLDWFRRNRGSKRRVLVFVHGFNTSFSEAAFRLAQISHDSHIEAAPVLFTWPSRGTPIDYLYDKESATYSRFALEDLLTKAAKSPDVGEVTVLAHSMGCWLTVEALRDLALRDKTIPSKISNVVLASPDIDIDVFRRQLAEMGPKRPRFTIFTSRNDHALALSRWLSGEVDRVGSADPTRYAAAAQALGITVIDTSNVKADDPVGHNAFADSPEMVRLLGLRLAGQSINARSTGLVDKVGLATMDAARAVGTTAGAVITSPAEKLNSAARETPLPASDPGSTVSSGEIAY
jgi:esterase/lipase superfamily enzyme